MSIEAQLHAELLRTQWRLIELLEALPPNDARDLLTAELEPQIAEAQANLPALTPWPELPAGKLDIYGSANNMTRMYRVCRLLNSSDRLLDIGTNFGYFGGMLATLVKPAAYTGIDLEQKYLDGVRHMGEANDLDIGHWVLEVGDLYKLTPEWVAKQEPTMVLLLEVLEHLPDPQLALRTLAEVMPAESHLLFSVPMLGRLEACWGHHSLFDAERVRQLCAQAGLHIQWVEPVVNTWKLVLASTSPEPSERVLSLIESQLPGREPVTIDDPAFNPIRLKRESTVTGGGAISTEGKGVTLTGSAPRRWLFRKAAEPVAVGLRLPVDGLRALRLELEGIDTAGIEAVTVEGRTADGAPTCRWEFVATETKRMPRTANTYVFRPGQAAAGYRPVLSENADDTRTVEIAMRLAPGASGGFALRRAAFVR